jgi:hypothetical protein
MPVAVKGPAPGYWPYLGHSKTPSLRRNKLSMHTPFIRVSNLLNLRTSRETFDSVAQSVAERSESAGERMSITLPYSPALEYVTPMPR